MFSRFLKNRITLIAVMVIVAILSISIAAQSRVQWVLAADSTHFSSVTGGSIKESDIMKGGSISGRKLDITPDEEGGKVTFEYDGVFSSAEMMDGVKDIISFTINDMASLAEKKFSVIAVTMEDMENPEEQIVYSIGEYGIGGNYLGLFTARIGYSDRELTEIAMYSGLYSTYKDMGYVYHTAIDNNISPGSYCLNGNAVKGDVRTFFIRYNNESGNRNIMLLPNLNEHYINNIDSQEVYHEGAYKKIEIPELFTSGYYKLKFQVLGAKNGLSITLNGDMDSYTVPFFKEAKYNFSVMEGENLEEEIKADILSRVSGVMKEIDISCVELTDKDGAEIDFNNIVSREEPYTFNARILVDGFGSNQAEFEIEVLERYNLYDEYILEIGEGDVHFPVVENLPDGFSYSVKLYSPDSSETDSPIFEGLSYHFSDIGNYKVIYEIYDTNLDLHNKDEIKFAELKVVDTTAPKISFTESYQSEYNLNEKIEIKTPVIEDNNPSGNPEWSAKVYQGESEISITDGKITLDLAGVYKIIYSFKDKSGNSESYEVRFIVVENDNEKPVIDIKGDYRQKYNRGEKIQIFDADVSDNLDKNLTVIIEVLLNGEPLEIKDGFIVPEEEGLLLITYSATDSFGNTEISVIRAEITGGGGLSGIIIALIVIGVAAVAASVTVIIVIMKKKRGKIDEEKRK